MSERRNIPLDSRDGMQILAEWARTHGYVLQPFHAELAAKHGVSLEGVTVSRPIPTQ